MVRHWPLLLIILLFTLISGIYSVANPLFEAPDEVWHYGYVHWLAGGHGLAKPDDAAGAARWAQEGSQPPLYYLLSALLTAAVPQGEWDAAVRYNPHTAVGNADSFGNRNYLLHGTWDRWPWRDVALGAHIVRFFSILLGVLTIVCTYAVGRSLAPRWLAVAPLSAALVAFNPQFLFISASVSNDNLVTAICAAGVWLCLRIAVSQSRPRWRWFFVLGLLVGLAALSKLSGLLLGGFALVALTIAAWRLRSWRLWLESGAVVVAVALLVAGWWYWRNWQLYADPLGLSGMFALLPARTEAAGPAELWALAPGVWRSTWAVFGWFNVKVDDWVYWLYSLLTLAGLGGWLVVALRRERRQAGQLSWLTAALALLWSFAVGLALVRWAQINYPQGRLLFPALAAAMPLLAVGLLAWWPLAWQTAVAASGALGMAILAAAVPFLWIAPVYAPPPLAAPAAALPNPVAKAVGAHVQLIGYIYDSGPLRPGDEFDITLYWRSDALLPVDYSVFVHLVDELDIVQAQSDSHPAQGSRPTSGWAAGDIVVDRHRLRLPAGLPAPGRLRVEVGMYEYASGVRLPTVQGDSLSLGAVAVAPLQSAAGIPNPIHINFDDKIALVGYNVDQRSLHRGDALGLSLWWEGLAAMERDYAVFIHLTLPPDAVWAQQDRMPQDGAAPTSIWKIGQVVEDRYELTVPVDAPPGIYAVGIGLYDKDSQERLAVNFDDADVVLTHVRVEP